MKAIKRKTAALLMVLMTSSIMGYQGIGTGGVYEGFKKVYGIKQAFATGTKLQGAVVEGDKIVFRYKNEKIKTGSNYSIKVKVDGKLYNMSLDKKSGYYTYSFLNPKIKVYTYSFVETINKVTREFADPLNSVAGISRITYKGLDIKLSLELSAKAVTTSQNAVAAISLSGIDAKNKYYKEVYLDLREVGGTSKVKVDKALMKQTIAISDKTSEGEKTIVATLVDTTGAAHVAKTAIKVEKKQGEGTLAFDFDEARIYFMVTDRFFNGDAANDDPHGQNYDKKQPMAYHGGDLKGITEKLDYLKELGINTIWITPIVENTDFNQMLDGGSQYSYHGYWTKDFTSLDPHLGSMEDLKTLIDQAHDRGIKLMVDVVLNHAGYGMKNADTKYAKVSNYPSDAERKAFAGMFRNGSGTDEWTKELSGLPDFKTEEAAVRDKIIAWQSEWLARAKTDKGNTIDYFRVDTVRNVDDTTFKAFKNSLTSISPDFKLMGEYFNGSVTSDGDQLRTGQMDALLDFSYKNLADHFVNGKLESIEKMLEERADKIDNTATMAQFLGSHDENGFLTRQTINGDLDKLKVAAALQITDKGIPVVYYGEELGATGFNGYPKDANRYDMPWGNLKEEKYKSLHDHYAKLLNIRKEYSLVFSKGERKTIAGGNADKYIVVERNYKEQKVLVAFNIDSSDKEVQLKAAYKAGSKVRDCYSGKIYTVGDNGMINFIIPKETDGGVAILAAYEK